MLEGWMLSWNFGRDFEIMSLKMQEYKNTKYKIQKYKIQKEKKPGKVSNLEYPREIQVSITSIQLKRRRNKERC